MTTLAGELGPWPLRNRVFLMRHGLAESNVQGILVSDPGDGVPSFGLVEQGRAESMEAAVKLEANLTADTVTAEELTEKLVIVSSDFKRAIETAQIMHSHFKPNTPIKTDVALRERDFGEFNRAPWREALPIILENDRVNPTERVHGCEPVPEMVVRVMRVLKTIEEEYTDKIVVIISHSNPLHALWAICNRVSSTERFKDLKHFKNCEVREFKFV